jgi:outer membrane autotransporter protein
MDNLGTSFATGGRRYPIFVRAASAFAAALIVSMSPAQAQDATWLPAPFNNDFNNNNNWNPATVPTDTAFFNTSVITSLSLPTVLSIGGWTFNAGADDYDFTLPSGVGSLAFNDAGIVINGGSAAILIPATGIYNVYFNNNSTAGSATINNTNSSGSLIFYNNSTAGSATINNDGNLYFRNNSTAGKATITNNNLSVFFETSTAGNANITNNQFLQFAFSSSAGNATITNNANLSFSNLGWSSVLANSTAGNAAITNNAAAAVVDFSAGSGPAGDNKLSAGSLAGTGSFFLGMNQLTVGGNNQSTEVSGVISDCGSTGTECVASTLMLPSTGGSLVKTGTGILTLSGANTYTGPTTVNGGELRVNGSIVSDVTVNGGTLGGTGQTGAVTANGGTIAPGNSIGTMRVNGNFTLKSGATYEVEANANGQSDKVIVKGTVNLTGATLKVLAANGNYNPKTDYTIIENDGSDAVVGKFGSVSTNLAFLTPAVDYAAGDGNDVVLTLLRTVTFRDVARTRNEKAVAGALDKFPTDNPLFLSVLTQTAEGARQAFNALSGEVHATVAGTLVDDSRYAREAVLGRMIEASHTNGALGANGPRVASYDSQAMMLGGEDAYHGRSRVEVPQSQPLAFWTEGYGAFGWFGGDGNAAKADRNLGGFISGMDAHVGGSWRVGLATGASFSDVSVDKRYSGANTKTYHLGGYVGGDVGGVALRGGGLWAWTDIETSRAVVFPNFYERQKADYDADTGQLFGEIAYPTQMGGVELEPFAGLAFVSVESGGFREKGGAQASLRTSGFDQDVGYTTVGLRAAQTMMWGAMAVTPHIEAAWLHAFDDVTPGASLAFATTGIGFAVDGVPLAEDSAILDAGVDFAINERLSAGVSYTGQYAEKFSDNGVKGRLTWLFN